ncbi:pyruvate dehydrogenase phosphatase regulatory subunit, mitochondrial-like, partial [Actinia tenebrosa]|uniref:Pyruvate dehydrogenase phosphatase regulatory subunit, mitochondrial-like n=1 Tax=Actinia tenebrosa TaxID=6105 RepID=A0A6P8I2F9_ACTTE
FFRKSIPRISTYLQSAFSFKSSLTNAHSSRGASTNVGTPSQAQVVIAGGGVIGCSVAYHLAKLGWKDILLLEQGSVSGGTTWHAVGLLGKLRGTRLETYICDYAETLYKRLEEETGLQSGFKKCGGLLIARSDDRLTAVKRTAVQAR